MTDIFGAESAELFCKFLSAPILFPATSLVSPFSPPVCCAAVGTIVLEVVLYESVYHQAYADELTSLMRFSKLLSQNVSEQAQQR